VSEDEKQQYLSIAKKAALLAGKYLKKDDPLNRKVTKELVHDVKIEADIQSEKIIIDYLMKNSDFSILSEEKGTIERSNKDYFWVVDPVDGSLNYSRRMPICCVSIGLWKGDEPILGVIYDFNRNEMYYGIVGINAWLNDKLIKVSKIGEKAKSILCTGFPIMTNFETENIKTFIDQIRDYKKIRLIGSAALSIAYVATGRVDGYYERDIALWDIGGGIPIILGAGGKINILEKTDKQYSYNVHVTNGIVE